MTLTLIINQDILWLHIAMQHPTAMAIGYSINNLFDDTFDFLFRQFLFFGLQVFLEIIVIIVKNNFKAFLFWFILDVEQSTILIKVTGQYSHGLSKL